MNLDITETEIYDREKEIFFNETANYLADNSVSFHSLAQVNALYTKALDYGMTAVELAGVL